MRTRGPSAPFFLDRHVLPLGLNHKTPILSAPQQDSRMIPYSLLDLAPIPSGQTAADALRHSLDLAQHAERWGYHRYWLAEYHNSRGIASSATAVVVSSVIKE